MDLQQFVDGMMAKDRLEKLADSSQLALGELILNLEAVKDKQKPITFDFSQKPAGACSWRGSYCELGLEYSENGGGTASWNSDVVEYESPYGNSYKSEEFKLDENPITQNFLDMLKALKDKEMVGWKGGDFKMHKGVSVYLGNCGQSGVSDYNGKEYASVAVFGIEELDDSVVIVTSDSGHMYAD